MLQGGEGNTTALNAIRRGQRKKPLKPDIIPRGIKISLSYNTDLFLNHSGPLFERPGSSMPKTIIHCVRHAQGYHNLSDANHILPDPSLTGLGEAQCEALRRVFPYHDKVTHLVASPLRRTLYTCLLGFEAEVKSGKKIIALPELQETSDVPCDTGSDPAKLREEFGTGKWNGTVDLSLVHEGWNDKSANTKWAPSADKIGVRAREARRWLRDLAMKSGADAEIVVVTHGGYLHYFTEDWTGHVKSAGTGWENAEFRSYNFQSEIDDGASVVETEESKNRRRHLEKPLTEDEKRELKATADLPLTENGLTSSQLKL